MWLFCGLWQHAVWQVRINILVQLQHTMSLTTDELPSIIRSYNMTYPTLHHTGSLVCNVLESDLLLSSSVKETMVPIRTSALKWASLSHSTNDWDQIRFPKLHMEKPKMTDNMENNIHIPCNIPSSKHSDTAWNLHCGPLGLTFSSVLI